MKKAQKLNVGLVFDDTLDSTDGVAQYVKVLGAWLARRGHKVSYLVGETKLDEWAGGRVYTLAKNQKVRFNGNQLSMPLPADKSKIRRVLQSEKFDVLHVMVPYSPFMAQKIITSASKDTAVVGTFHIYPSGWLTRAGSRLLRAMYGKSLSRFDEIVSVSPAAAQYALQSYGIKSEIVPNTVNLDFYKSVAPIKTPDGQHIIFLGRLVKRKGVFELIKAFKLLSAELPGVRLTIAGDGPKRMNLENLAKQSGLSKSISFLGYIDEKDKPSLLAGADIACFPSLYGESFGIVLLEAMSAGSEIVLGGDNPGYRSVLNAQPSLLINPRDTRAFADRLKLLLTNKTEMARLSAWQAKEVEKYDINNVGRQIEKVYAGAIARLREKSHN